ncbi:MAG: hypothetical protein WBG86_23060 [Polyangiales bacterium]
MKRTPRTLALFCIVQALSLGACGDDSTGNAGAGGTAGGGTGGSAMPSCPTLAESWVIEEHCLAGFEAQVVPFTQTECALVVAGPFSGLEGTVGENGEIDLSGSLGVLPYECQGTATASDMDLLCNSDCPVRLAAQ